LGQTSPSRPLQGFRSHRGCSTGMSPSPGRPSQGSPASRSAPSGVAARLVRRSLHVVFTTARYSAVRASVRPCGRPATLTGFVTLSGFGLRCPLRSSRGPDRPSWGSCPFSDVSGGIRMSRAIQGPAPSVLGVSHPLDGLLSLAPCGLAGSAAAHGVLARAILSEERAETRCRGSCTPSSAKPCILDSEECEG